MSESICHKCRVKSGYEPRDDGFHTGVRKFCDSCGKLKVILPSRHFKKVVENENI